MDKPYCFVIISFNKGRPSVSKRFDEVIQPMVRMFGYDCVRTIDLQYNGRITDKIWECIRNSHFIIADLTDNRPNCYYELGIAHGLGKIVIPIIDNHEAIPFDLNDHNFIIARNIDELSDGLKPRLISTLQRKPNAKTKVDTQKGQWGKKAKRNNRLLSAKITPVSGNKGYFQLLLQVASTDPTTPLKGEVHFYLHDTFHPPSRVVKVKRGVATLELLVWGAFTVGAETDNGRTKLELDLFEDKSFPAQFRKR